MEQELVGLALRLDAAAPRVSEAKPRELIEGARRLVQSIQEEARALLQNLRGAEALAGWPLDQAIERALAHWRVDREISVRCLGPLPALPGVVIHELIRLAQESTANAIKHGAARRIEILLDAPGALITMRVSDNGAGFDPATRQKPGHFGLIGMRERIKKLGGAFALQSAPGAGTTLDFSIPQ